LDFPPVGRERHVQIAALLSHALNPQNLLGAFYSADYKDDSGEFTRSFALGRIGRHPSDPNLDRFDRLSAPPLDKTASRVGWSILELTRLAQNLVMDRGHLWA
jgi:hypothetical protein